MRIETFVHRGADEVIPGDTLHPIERFLRQTQFAFGKNSATELRSVILAFLAESGWAGEVRVAPTSRISVTGMKGEAALALQTANMARFYADLLKLQLLFHNGKATAAVYILPSKGAAARLGENIANFDRFVEELRIFSSIVTIPIYVIGLEKDR